MIRILHTIGSLERGGIQQWIRNIVVASKDRGLHHAILIRKQAAGEDGDEIERDGGQVHDDYTGGGLLMCVAGAMRNIRPSLVDVVHCHGEHYSTAIYAAVGRWRGVPIVAHAHNVRPPSRTALNKLYDAIVTHVTCRFATELLATSEEAGAAMFGRVWKERRKGARVLHCGIRTPVINDLARKATREELGIPASARVMGAVGRLTRAKNIGRLLEICAEMRRDERNVYVLVVGDGPLREGLSLQAVRLGIEDKVRFVGAQKDVAPYYSAMDVLVMPSINEGWGLSAIEAQCAGVPAVVSTALPVGVILSPISTKRLDVCEKDRVWIDSIVECDRYGREEIASTARKAASDRGLLIETSIALLEAAYRAMLCKAPAVGGEACNN
ncbi:glycosyltransferase [uncultured Paludibaculum sp.]|uniref:glycosyltransferase n=1 Tax=uncultured Paludibaculum sp. TaxID=1765020 RepID=UPI002AAAC2F5|nr:glycosyltransferase [uncultured Paludibaculum sp.]